MPKRASTAALLTLAIDRELNEPIHRQIYRQIRQRILSGTLVPGMRLPSTRTLARETGCSRSTVELAFEQLLCEGYLSGKVGSGTIVSTTLKTPWQPPASGFGVAGGMRPAPAVSHRCLELAAQARVRSLRVTAFSMGYPDVEHFPFDVWSKLSNRAWRRPARELTQSEDPAGYRPLREAIANYLRVVRGIVCSANQIVITTGARQAVDFAVRLLLNDGDQIWLEDPGFPSWRKLMTYGYGVFPVRVDAEGICVADGRALAPHARMAIVTPARQFPTGVAMTLRRRLELLEWAYEAGAWIIEDDYDSEFRFKGQPLATLLGLDKRGHVVYVGTFSKTIFPGLRLGYMVLPERHMDDFCRARVMLDYFPPTGPQPVLAEFIEQGHFAAHHRRMRDLYAARQQRLVETLRRHLDGLVDPETPESGMHLVVPLGPRVTECMTDFEASRLCARESIDAAALGHYYFGPATRQALLLGYSAVPEADIEPSVRKIAHALRKGMERGATRAGGS